MLPWVNIIATLISIALTGALIWLFWKWDKD